MVAVARGLEIKRDALQAALRRAVAVIPGKSPLPIVSCLRLWASEGVLRIGATDLQTSLVLSQEIDAAVSFDLAVPGVELAAYVSSLTGEMVSLEEGAKALTVRAGRAHATFRTQAASDFPVLPEAPEGGIELPSAVLREALERVIFAADWTNGKQPFLHGVWLQLSGTTLQVSAADGYRLSTLTRELLLPVAEPCAWLPTAPAMKILLGLLPEGEALVTVAEDRHQVVFAVGDAVLSMRQIEGPYSDFERLIRADCTTWLTVPKDRMLEALKQLAVLSKEDSYYARLEVQDGRLTLRGKNLDGDTAEAEVLVTVEGDDPAQIAANGKYLSEAVSAVAGGSVRIGFNTPTQPILIVPVEQPLSHRQLVMAMHRTN